jgi:hypothetical protein
METALRQLVISRAAGRCEYCQFPEAFCYLPFQIDHVIAQKHGGPTVEGNLAWSCYYCNSYKGPNLSGWLVETDQVVRLFHPRKDRWHDHFVWHGALLVPKTDIGQVTVDVLEMNHADAIQLREWLLELALPDA